MLYDVIARTAALDIFEKSFTRGAGGGRQGGLISPFRK